jgi:poly(A) polymerase Pap1
VGQEKTFAEQHGKWAGVVHGKVNDLVKKLHAGLEIVQPLTL